MQTISIKHIRNDIEFFVCDENKSYTKDDVQRISAGYQSKFIEIGLSPGDRVCACVQEDLHHIAILFAMIDYGIELFIATARDINNDFINHYNIKKVILRGDVPVNVSNVSSEYVVKIDINDVIESNTPYIYSPNDILYTATTSGSSGYPKTVSHKHSSVISALNTSRELYFTEESVVWFNHNLAHLGISSVFFFPALFSAKKVVIPPFWDQYNVQAMDLHKPDVDLFFNITFKFNEELFNRDLSYVKYVLTGGEPFMPVNAKGLINAGVQKIAVIYGLTECLPPLIHNIIDSTNINAYDPQNLGTLVKNEGKFEIINKQLVIKDHPHMAYSINEVQINELETGDQITINDRYFKFLQRNKNLIRISGHLVDIDTLLSPNLSKDAFLYAYKTDYIVIFINKTNQNRSDIQLEISDLINEFNNNNIKFETVITTFTYNPLGKVIKQELRKLYNDTIE